MTTGGLDRLAELPHQYRWLLSRVAHRLAVLHGVRLLRPFTYLPSSSLLRFSERSLLATLQRLSSTIDQDTHQYHQPASLASSLPVVGADTSITSGHFSMASVHQMALIAVACDPLHTSARITLGAILLRMERPAAAEEQFRVAEGQATCSYLKSRAVSNRAVVQETYGDLRGASRLAELAVQYPAVSSLAVRNLKVYRGLMMPVN